MNRFEWVVDAPQAWLIVPVAELVRRNLHTHISHRSLLHDNMAYLDRTHDAPIFLNALRAEGVTPCIYFMDKQNTAVRAYRRYSTEGVTHG